MGKCADCKTREAAWQWPCIKVVHRERKDEMIDRTETTMTQSIAGLYNTGLCPECEKKYAKKAAGGTNLNAAASLGLGFGCLGILFALFTTFGSGNKPEPIGLALIWSAVGILLLGCAAVLLYNKCFGEKKFLEKPLEKRCFCLCWFRGETRYAPMGDGFYKDREKFKNINLFLLDDMAKSIYDNYVKNDRWKLLKVAETSEESLSDNPEDIIKRLTARAIMNKIGGDLLTLYTSNPDGFDAASEEAEVIRGYGGTLFDGGGLPAMIEMHASLAAANKKLSPNAIKNLDKLWDGIGGWEADL